MSAAMTGSSTVVSHDELETFLGLVVAQKGVGAESRPGQVALARDILDALTTKTRFSGVAPPGTGKSFAYLACAALLAAKGQRVLVSTELLGLQRQIVEEDLPLVARALAQHNGATLRYASFMGVNNYADPGRLLGLVEGLTGDAWKPASSAALTRGDLVSAREALREDYDASWRPSGTGAFSGAAVVRELVLWGLDSYVDGGHGDRAAMAATGMETAPDDWSLVAAGSEDRSTDKDLKGVSHKYDEARSRARAAQVVVANHALLGIEAVTMGGTVMETEKAGTFDHIVVDEAHALPAGIRGAGDGKVSGAALRDVGGRARRLLNDYDIDKEMTALANRLDELLLAAVQAGGQRGVLRLDPASPGVLPADFAEEVCESLFTTAGVFAGLAEDLRARLEDRSKARRAQAFAIKVHAAVKAAQRPQDESSGTFVARWIESSNGSAALRYTPIPVDGLALASLWHKATSGKPRGVVCVSATLPHGFGAQVAVAEPVRYPSPFARAFAESAVYVPMVTDPASEGLLGDNGRFDTQAHAAWAARHVVELVAANDGRALVVSATNNGAARYARDLEAALASTGITVYTQSSGKDRALTGFRRDERSVLVGTRSYMTGIDVAGESLSLVVLDRPPRAAGNVVDDARVALVARQKGCSASEASLDVYVADAASLLDQARGRLIRHTSDRGMVAVLDPRIHTAWPLWSPSLAEQQVYFDPLVDFGTRLSGLDQAAAWLRQRRTAFAQARLIADLEAQLAAGVAGTGA